MKTAALDLGDKWTGVALSDALGITARPYKTVLTTELIYFLELFITQEEVTTIIIGLPTTLKGTDSEQTLRVRAMAQSLKQAYTKILWVFWDERFSSKQAAHLKKSKTKEDKLFSHAIAAAIVLTSYLMYQDYQKTVSY